MTVDADRPSAPGPRADAWDALVAAHQAARPVVPPQEVPRHAPRAAVLACSDARVPPSVLFDQPAGNLFVVRIAGNTASPEALASFDYAVEKLGVELVVVLGHSNCGAVTAAAGGTCGGHLGPIVGPICELARSMPHAGVDELVTANVANTMAIMARHEGPLGRAITEGRVAVHGAVHDLATGNLHPVTAAGLHQVPAASN